jgi:signal transduction histidine kinase
MDDKEIVFLIFSASITILLISIGLVLFLVFFVRTKKRDFAERFKLMEAYEKELYNTKIEIKDQTLKYVGRELHDNIGQLLTVTRIHLKGLVKVIDNEKLTEVNNITARALEELRMLSRSLNNSDRAADTSLLKLVEQEITLIDKTGAVKPSLKVAGDVYNFDVGHEIICFRIMQEFVSNALKYSGCEHICFELDYQPGEFSFRLRDDGKGFDKHSVVKGSGLINIENRAKMIGAHYELKSTAKNGTTIIVKLKTNVTV